MNDNFLIVYNACEIQRNNLFWYIDCLSNLLNQDYDRFKVAISGCRISDTTKAGLQKYFGKRIYYNFIDENQTISVTFNHTVNNIVKNVGEFDGYIYVDSGMMLFCFRAFPCCNRAPGMLSRRSFHDPSLT